MTTPGGIAVNQGNGKIYIADSNNNNSRISVFDSSGSFLRAFGQNVVESGPGNTGTGFEIGVAADGDVCKRGTNFDPKVGGVMGTPRGVALDAAGNVYVSEQGNLRVQKFDADGNFLLAYGKDVVESGPGNTGTGFEICVAANGDVCKAGVAGSRGGEFASTFNGYLTVAPAGAPNAGNVLVADPANLRVQEFTPAGAFVRLWGWDVQGVNEVQTVLRGVPGNVATGGTYRLCKDVAMTECTGDLAFNLAGTGATSVQTALQGLFGAGNVTVAVGAGAAARTATFTGTLAGTDVDTLVCDGANLTYASAPPTPLCTVETTTQGAGGNVTTFEACEDAAICKAGVSGSGSGQFVNTVNRVAEDADGNIYTVESGTPNFRVQKFTLPLNVVTPQGNFCEAFCKGTAASSAPFEVGIDASTKNVLVTKAFAAGATPSCPNTGAPSVAERRILEFSQAGILEATHMACAEINNVSGTDVWGSTGDVFVSSAINALNLGIYGLNTPLLAPSVGFNAITDVTAHSATVSGFVNPNGPAELAYGSRTGYHFAYKRSADPTFISLPAADVDVGRGTSNQLVSVKLPGLEASTSYDVKLVATKPFAGSAETATFTFATPAAPAEVGIPSATTAATEDGDVRAALWGSVNPNSKPTTYRFEYGTTDEYGTKAPAPDESAGSGAAEIPVAEFIKGLEPSTTYHFRIVAKNVNGTVASPDRTFTTPPLGEELPDNRGIELVSPADKGTSGSVAVFQVVADQYQPWNQAAEDGDAMLYPIQNGMPTSTAGGWLRMHAGRTDEGWLSAQISAPSLIRPPRSVGANAFPLPSWVYFASPDLSCAILQSYNPVTEDTPQQSVEAGVENIYSWNAADGDYELITNVVPLNPTEPGGGQGFLYAQVEAADDCSRVYFRSAYDFIPGANSGLYEWDEGVLRDAGALPNGQVGANMTVMAEYAMPIAQENEAPAVAGGEVNREGAARWNAVSPDGSRFFFTAIRNEGPSAGKPGVFMREDGGASVVDVSQSQTAVPTNGARFEAASPDGSRVFFRANYGIAATSSSGPTDGRCGPLAPAETSTSSDQPIESKPCDLYAYDVETGDLTDLSADPNPADPFGAQIQGAVTVDQDGSHVYFAALGQLVPGKGRTYAENIAGEGSANIYLSHNGELSYVVTLNRGGVNGDLNGGEEFSGGYGVLMRRTEKWRAETSADGSRLLFESAANLTGYDSKGGRAVYLYSADTGGITCVSCPLDGEPTLVEPTGEVDSQPGAPNILSRPRVEGQTPRATSMSEDGSRVFFTSPDVLAPGAVEGKRNVYLWENGQVYFLARVVPSAAGGLGEYLDASASGDDVFITTSEQLVPQDRDFVADVYDVRVGGGFPFVEPPPNCQVDESVPLLASQIYCQGDPTPQPPAPSPASPGFTGPGNPPDPPKKKQSKKNKKKAGKKKANRRKGQAGRKRDSKRKGPPPRDPLKGLRAQAREQRRRRLRSRGNPNCGGGK